MTRTVNISLCSLFVVLWSSGWIGSKYGVGLVGPFTFLTWRYLIVVIILATLVLALGHWKPLSRKEWILHLNTGLLSHGLYLGASLTAMDYGMSAGMVALVTSMQPLFTAICAHYLIGERSNRRQWVGILIGFIALLGTIVNQLVIGESTLSYVLLFTAVFALTGATLMDRANTLNADRGHKKPAPLLQTLLIHSMAALVFFALCGFSLEQLETQWTSDFILAILYMAIVVSIGSYGCLFILLRRLPVVKVSALTYLTQSTTMLLAWVFLGETLSTAQWMGLAIVSCAVVIIHSGQSRHVASDELIPESESGPMPKPVSKPMPALNVRASVGNQRRETFTS
ncbi:DMT family transporter [Granulosicoccus sp.]|nr:DMT family transporter [Granulosicoccus sp.]MDB4223773.1 DMT family transporter [Granulosicoccus sp.]